MVQQFYHSQNCSIFYCSTLFCFVLPHWYSLLEKEKLPQNFLFHFNNPNLTYHVTIDSLALSNLSHNKHYNYTYSLCLYGLITIVHACP